MIIASDLDRTLMYSNRALEVFGRPEKTVLKPVERINGQWAGYMTEKAFDTLKQINRHCLFVPVTTRTTEQFKRFIIFEEEVPLTYAITTNGAAILHKGKPLKEWSDQIAVTLNNESASQEELLSALKKECVPLDGKVKQAEKLFFYYILNCLPSASEILAIRELANLYGWRASLQGRKLYFIPKAISKGSALAYICSREGMEAFAGAGDSVLDWDFLQNCQHRLVPSHGELISQIGNSNITLTTQHGIGAGEEILNHFVTALSLKI
jgi:hydroxymethylpyrimidine pyrophosphatase-like HAD family hydrolase